MIPNIYEQLAHEHHQTLLREAEHRRRLAEAQPAPPLHWLQRLATGLGGYLIVVGTRLQRVQAVE
ncbi:MAG TPA: hypothetical protein VF026_00390 [Ktedonobacteraceae bacterium]